MCMDSLETRRTTVKRTSDLKRSEKLGSLKLSNNHWHLSVTVSVMDRGTDACCGCKYSRRRRRRRQIKIIMHNKQSRRPAESTSGAPLPHRKSVKNVDHQWSMRHKKTKCFIANNQKRLLFILLCKHMKCSQLLGNASSNHCFGFLQRLESAGWEETFWFDLRPGQSESRSLLEEEEINHSKANAHRSSCEWTRTSCVHVLLF